MNTLKLWLEEKIRHSNYAPLLQPQAPVIIGGGEEILVAVGDNPMKVVYLGVRHGGETPRVGFAAKDRWANEEVEEAVESNGGTMREFLEDEMEADDDLEFDVQHFHEAGWFHFASDLSKPKGFFETNEGRELVWYYFEGYCRAILPIVSSKEE